MKIKRHLYKALLRPILEYPAVQLHNTHITNKRKIQRIQNKASRFITNTRLSDRVRSEHIHNTTKLKPMNIRHSKLATKQLNKIHNKYYNENININRGTNYTITANPRYRPQTSIFKNIQDFIYVDPGQCPWNSPTEPADWVPPDPLYV